MHITPGVPGIRQSRFFGMVSRGECSVGKEKRDVVWGCLRMKDRSGLTVDTARNMMAAGFDSVNPPFA